MWTSILLFGYWTGPQMILIHTHCHNKILELTGALEVMVPVVLVRYVNHHPKRNIMKWTKASCVTPSILSGP